MNESVEQTTETASEPVAPPPQVQTPVEEPARLGPLSRLSGVLLSPGETFEDINRKATWLAPMIVAMLTVLASTFFFQWRVNPDWDQIIRTQIRKSVEKSGQSIPEDQLEQRVRIGKSIAKFTPIIGAVFTPIFYVVLAGIFALGLMLIQAKTTFKKILSVVSWSCAGVGVVAAIVTMASLMVRDQESLHSMDPTQGGGIVPSNLGVFLSSTTSSVIRTLASSIDIFTIWPMILLCIGFAAIAGSRKIKTSNTATVVFGFWVVYVLLKVGWAAAFPS